MDIILQELLDIRDQLLQEQDIPDKGLALHDLITVEVDVAIRFRKKFLKKYKPDPVDSVDFLLKVENPPPTGRTNMPADFQLPVGVTGALTSAAIKGGNPVAFPAGTVFKWNMSDGTLATFDDDTLEDPHITGVAVEPDPANPPTITLTINENGFVHSMSHTIDIIAAPVADPIDSIDFTFTLPVAVKKIGVVQKVMAAVRPPR